MQLVHSNFVIINVKHELFLFYSFLRAMPVGVSFFQTQGQASQSLLWSQNIPLNGIPNLFLANPMKASDLENMPVI